MDVKELSAAAAGGEDAQKQLAQASPQLFILDQLSPGIDGLTLCKKTVRIRLDAAR